MPQTLIEREQVFRVVSDAIAHALTVEKDLIRPETVLTTELDAESLDFLDISYHVEQAFGLRMARYSALDHMEEIFGEGFALDEDGGLTPAALSLLKLRFPDVDALRPGMRMEDLLALITVDSIVDRVLWLLDTLPDRCVHCARDSWILQDGTRIVCGSCNEPPIFRSEDDLVQTWLLEHQQKGIS